MRSIDPPADISVYVHPSSSFRYGMGKKFSFRQESGPHLSNAERGFSWSCPSLAGKFFSAGGREGTCEARSECVLHCLPSAGCTPTGFVLELGPSLILPRSARPVYVCWSSFFPHSGCPVFVGKAGVGGTLVESLKGSLLSTHALTDWTATLSRPGENL